jgi:hypothetical protein
MDEMAEKEMVDGIIKEVVKKEMFDEVIKEAVKEGILIDSGERRNGEIVWKRTSVGHTIH